MKYHYVYFLIDVQTKILLYIGRSNNPRERLLFFIRKNQREAEIEYMLRFTEFEEAQAAELAAIAKEWPPYNKHFVSSRGSLGISRLGHRPEAESRFKMSLSHRGHSVSEKTRKLIRDKLLGHPVSAETRAKIGKANTRSARVPLPER